MVPWSSSSPCQISRIRTVSFVRKKFFVHLQKSPDPQTFMRSFWFFFGKIFGSSSKVTKSWTLMRSLCYCWERFFVRLTKARCCATTTPKLHHGTLAQKAPWDPQSERRSWALSLVHTRVTPRVFLFNIKIKCTTREEDWLLFPT